MPRSLGRYNPYTSIFCLLGGLSLGLILICSKRVRCLSHAACVSLSIPEVTLTGGVWENQEGFYFHAELAEL